MLATEQGGGAAHIADAVVRLCPRVKTPNLTAGSWYWQRLLAMTPSEVALHARKKLRQVADRGRGWKAPRVNVGSPRAFPRLPVPEDAPPKLREALGRELDAIVAGRWKAFDGLDLHVDDPPRWHCDYLAGADLATQRSAFALNSRALPAGGDIKLVWELSRWSQVVRLAMAAFVLGSEPAREKCIEWLEDWVKQNPPYRGWNWTSALEVGIRLVQFTWLDALLTGWSDSSRHAGRVESRLAHLRQSLLPSHVRYAWRYRSFGSSANNHLIGELTGCITATARWPGLTNAAPSLDALQASWEREVLKQFAPDGGNAEQALNYHLFSFELCMQALRALEATDREISPRVRERLWLATAFYRDVQVSSDPWDYGDSDGAYVTPFFAENPIHEWREWMATPKSGTGVAYWLGDPPPPPPGATRRTIDVHGWRYFPDSGIAVRSSSPWWLRWDLSPLGYLSTAAHGHSDALHLSIWNRGVALIVDPGTGVYYTDQSLRTWLASGSAHNGPRPCWAEHPQRRGTFLWGAHHSVPSFAGDGSGAIGLVDLGRARVWRRLTVGPEGCLQVEDGCFTNRERSQPFVVRWQFAPGSLVQQLTNHDFLVERQGVAVKVTVAGGWQSVELIAPGEAGTPEQMKLEGIVSPAFRQTCRAPLLKLCGLASPVGSGGYRTAFSEVG